MLHLLAPDSTTVGRALLSPVPVPGTFFRERSSSRQPAGACPRKNVPGTVRVRAAGIWTHAYDACIINTMKRTSLLLPPELRNRAERRAKQLGISFGELVRRALVTVLDTADAGETRDPFYADAAIHDGDAPPDASVHHDEHLYGGRR
jgi:hypothetical protein